MDDRSHYHATLVDEVMANSTARTWDNAVLEWEIAGCEEDTRQASSCVCGHPHLRYLFTIVNERNGNELFPIGSVCINQFGRVDLDDEAAIRERLFRLLHALEEGRFISLDSELFSRKLLKFLFDEGAFQPNEYNEFDGANDYQFMLDMFNKHNEPTTPQRRKIRAVIMGSIRPYLRGLLEQQSR